MRYRSWFLAAALLLPTAARAASSLTDEVVVSSGRASETSPRSGSLGNTLSGIWELNERIALTGRFGLTADKANDPQTGQRFGDQGGTIALFGLGTNIDPVKHLSLSAEADLSPKAKQSSDTGLTLETATGATTLDALLVTQASSAGGVLSIGYDSADPDAEEPSTFDYAAVLEVGATHFSTEQSIKSIVGANGRVYSAKVLDTYCTDHPLRSFCRYYGQLKGQQDQLTQIPLSLNLSGTLFESTDIGLGFTYYVYDKDPTEVGIFTLTATGRTSSASFGAGVPIAPQQFAIRPDIAHDFGPVNVDLRFEYGQYVGDEGHEVAIGVRAKWRITKHWRLHAGLTFSRDVPGAALTQDATTDATAPQPVTSGAFVAGLRYSF